MTHYNIYPANTGYYATYSDSEKPKTIPIIQSYTYPPLGTYYTDFLSLCEQTRPSYVNPFTKISYTYQEFTGHGNNNYGIMTEKRTSIFGPELNPPVIHGELALSAEEFEQYKIQQQHIGFNVYANLWFFLLQYGIIAAFVFIILKPQKK